MDPVKLSTITGEWMPALKSVYGDDTAAITKAIGARLKMGDEDIPVVNEQGEPVEIEEIILVGAAPADDAGGDEGEGGDDMTLESVKAATRQAAREAVDEALKHIKPQKRTNKSFNITGGTIRNDDKGRLGFKHFGEYCQSIVKACNPSQRVIDKRLMTKDAPVVFGSEGVGADGGFAVPPVFQEQILQLVEGEESLLSQTDNINTTSNNLTFPTDETTDWQTTGGILAATPAEGGQKPESRPALQEVNMRLSKITSLVKLTDELLEDAAALNSYVPEKAGRKIDFEVSNQIINGQGAGEALGILTSAATIVVTRATTDQVNFADIVGMYSRMYAPCISRATWIIHHEVLPQLFQMAFDPGAASPVPAYMPPNGLSDAPYGTLMGRPIIVHQAAQQLADSGDVIFACLPEYRTLTKSGGVQAATSIHLHFDFDITTFRFVLRFTGQPKISAPIQPLNGSATLSPFVVLNTDT